MAIRHVSPRLCRGLLGREPVAAMNGDSAHQPPALPGVDRAYTSDGDGWRFREKRTRFFPVVIGAVVGDGTRGGAYYPRRSRGLAGVNQPRRSMAIRRGRVCFGETCIMAITFVTTTSYGTWLPGDLRGYVQRGIILPGNPKLMELSRQLMKSEPVFFSASERDRLFDALVAACDEFGYRLSDVTIESWHLHFILWHGEDAIETVMGRLKTRMRQALARGRIWTEGYCGEPLFDDAAIEQVQEYIARHDGCRMMDGRVIRK
jgi:REP element-mobilizing transposase RayT